MLHHFLHLTDQLLEDGQSPKWEKDVEDLHIKVPQVMSIVDHHHWGKAKICIAPIKTPITFCKNIPGLLAEPDRRCP